MNERYIKIDADAVRIEIERLIASLPDLEEDDVLRADMLEAETDLHKVADKLISVYLDYSSRAKAVKEREDTLKARRERMEASADGIKGIMLSLLQAAQVKSLKLTEATVTLGEPKKRVDIFAEWDVPSQLCKITVTPDKVEIKKQIEAGEGVPGARLVDGEYSLTVRTK